MHEDEKESIIELSKAFAEAIKPFFQVIAYSFTYRKVLVAAIAAAMPKDDALALAKESSEHMLTIAEAHLEVSKKLFDKLQP